PFRRAGHDRPEERPHRRDQFHRRAARRGIPYPLWCRQGRDHQPGKRSFHGAWAPQYSGQLRGARLGGYGYVRFRTEKEGGPEGRNRSNSSEARRHGRGNRRPDSFCRIRPGNLHHGRSNQCERRFGAMRIGVRGVLAGMALAGFLCAGSALPANAQDETLMPEQSAAKAKQLIQAAIQAQGGNAYLNVRDVTCTAQVSQFDHGGNLSGYDKEIEYLIPPDKERDENLPKRNIITVFNGDKGWSLDRGGVSEV